MVKEDRTSNPVTQTLLNAVCDSAIRERSDKATTTCKQGLGRGHPAVPKTQAATLSPKRAEPASLNPKAVRRHTLENVRPVATGSAICSSTTRSRSPAAAPAAPHGTGGLREGEAIFCRPFISFLIWALFFGFFALLDFCFVLLFPFCFLP